MSLVLSLPLPALGGSQRAVSSAVGAKAQACTRPQAPERRGRALASGRQAHGRFPGLLLTPPATYGAYFVPRGIWIGQLAPAPRPSGPLTSPSLALHFWDAYLNRAAALYT